MESSNLETPDPAGTPVFVDDSGHRLARARVAARVLVGLLASYTALLAVGLTGSASLPAIHLADLGRLPARSAASPTLSADDPEVALPAALADKSGGDGGAARAGPTGATIAPITSTSEPVGNSPGAASTVPSGSPGATPPGKTKATTPSAAPTSTTSTGSTTLTTSTATSTSTTSTVPTTPTTKRHGPPTSVPHGHGKNGK